MWLHRERGMFEDLDFEILRKVGVLRNMPLRRVSQLGFLFSSHVVFNFHFVRSVNHQQVMSPG